MDTEKLHLSDELTKSVRLAPHTHQARCRSVNRRLSALAENLAQHPRHRNGRAPNQILTLSRSVDTIDGRISFESHFGQRCLGPANQIDGGTSHNKRLMIAMLANPIARGISSPLLLAIR
jgi:hypothetical protein